MVGPFGGLFALFNCGQYEKANMETTPFIGWFVVLALLGGAWLILRG